MKKTYLLLVVAASFGVALSSCNKIKSKIALPTTISWSYEMTMTVPPEGDTTVAHSVSNGGFSYNLDSMIKKNTSNLLSLSNIDTFEVTGCTLTINNPDANNNFQNFQMASLSFSTNYNGTKTSMGEIDDNPNTYASTLTVPVNSSVNLKNYIAPAGTTSINYEMMGKLRKATTDSLSVTVHVDYNIHVTP